MSDAAIDTGVPAPEGVMPGQGDVLLLREEWRTEPERPRSVPLRLVAGSGQRRPQAAAFDEDALRRMVAEIVREELRGSLGSRLTGAVRKLVRSEMARLATLTR
ncbi:hypothetical protein [Roseitranquillus sediminis]|uniref:hypothetical protein n=1 Tax=Roseitranquillus sediminis TaxID=2809051 RepID=UPI001D0C6DAD|nr:hypothetical protein [Roseitranquillus sediminis]MBM9595805.1 hypothetical protein [Roseitranquillus sediminis]